MTSARAPKGTPTTVVPQPGSKTKAVAPEDVFEAEEIQEPFEYKTFQPRDISNFEGTLFVKNNSNTFVSFDDGKDHILKLGRPRTSQTSTKYDQEDSIKVLEPEIARHPGFQRFWKKGNVIVTDNPDILDHLDDLAADTDIETDRIGQTYVNGQVQLKMPFPIEGLDPRYPNPNDPNAVRFY